MLVQIQPTYLVSYHEKKSNYTSLFERVMGLPVSSNRNISGLGKKRTSVNLSSTAIRALRKSAINLYSLAEPYNAVDYNGRVFKNFRAAFVTLTLPSAQEETDITLKRLLGTFLQSLRNTGRLNYVWRAELQKNGNIHFHILIDRFFDVRELQRKWNQVLEPKGLIEGYRQRFQSMSIYEYARVRGKRVEDVARAYEKGVSENWNNPPTVHVEKVESIHAVSVYLSKYMGKEEKDQDYNEGDTVRASKFGRSWGRSQSLSNIKYYAVDMSEVEVEYYTACTAPGSRVVHGRYHSIVFFDRRKIGVEFLGFVDRFVKARAVSSGYYEVLGINH